MMKTAYLDRLPAALNRFKVHLDDDEKVIFTAIPQIFGTETDQSLGVEPFFTLTNRRIITDNHTEIFSAHISDDMVSCEKKQLGKLFKTVYFEILLNKELPYGEKGDSMLKGFRFYFEKKDSAEFERLMSSL